MFANKGGNANQPQRKNTQGKKAAPQNKVRQPETMPLTSLLWQGNSGAGGEAAPKKGTKAKKAGGQTVMQEMQQEDEAIISASN